MVRIWIFLLLGLLGVASCSGSPATRPTPGFSEVELQPATVIDLPPPIHFLKALMLAGGGSGR